MSAIVDTVFDFLDEGDRTGALKFAHLHCASFSDEDLLRVVVRFKDNGTLFGSPKIMGMLGKSQGKLFGIPRSVEDLGTSIGVFGRSLGFLDEVPARSLTAGSPAERSLDFFIYPALRGASRALEVFINLHPQLHAAPRIQVDRAFEAAKWDGLVADADFLRARISNLKSGLVLHGGGGSLRTFLGVASLIRSDKPWIHVVREPVSAVLSSVNHMINGISHGYSFARMQLPWQLDEDISTAPTVNFEVPEISDPIPSQIDEYVQISAELKQDYRFGLPYAEFFQNWSVLDVDDLSAKRVDKGMALLFSMLGVDPSFRHPWFREQMHGKLPRFLYNNPVIVSAFGNPLVLMLGVPGDNLRCHDLRDSANYGFWRVLGIVGDL